MAAYQLDKIFKRFKANEKLINLVNQFGISKSIVVFKIPIARFLNNYPKMRKYLHFFNTNFKTNKVFAKKMLVYLNG